MKAVLVLDEMPKECDECPMHDFGWGEYCMATGKSVKAEGKEPWCPLKAMPERKRLPHELDDDDITFGRVCGWNDCIEELEK